MRKHRIEFEDSFVRQKPFASPTGYAVLHSERGVETDAKASSCTGSRLAHLCDALPKLIYFAKKQGK